MQKVKPKKHLGQHFLIDLGIAENIAHSLTGHQGVKKVLEIGPGMGVLTDFLLEKQWELFLVDIDKESIAYLNNKYPQITERIIEADFLRKDFAPIMEGQYAIIGNFPYNISSQILFKVLENKDQVTEVVCMLQKEVAQRIASPKGNKDYGILSVFLQAFYDIEYLFSVPPEVFNPPPRVNSGVIRLTRNQTQKLDCDEKMFFSVVKQGFGTRRKTLRNALKGMSLSEEMKADPVLDKRAEQLDVAEFVELTNKIQKSWKT
ncbi:16S rRNA methyltransferase [Rhodonellum psychrophilum GCM71 = DSM 17998]|uniref:Ribosomal RNA small subunit methyltransferase A n=2 Tax=Rhodonellum TaxID=336827 RepID=U5C8P0_9BACT|nr:MULTISPECIES: 16S rRNA (adenine(1518)-N(6)/adenine(1519)-N(6))-dimethyltransferase RsmA [Rhodonellum]ERM84577.1 16S rRNA methyltransferase [Rhodonellum psychrophilum GCM71 = DSM 17998]MDO9554845.1 16S rRNA (adenine(1518)-N(6)/adenine(1519)-N(6))-dimethyltransferase RsmA [Rhodonellum sp.]